MGRAWVLEVQGSVGVMAQVAKTGAWRLPIDKRDHQRAVRKQRRRDRRVVGELRRVYDRR